MYERRINEDSSHVIYSICYSILKTKISYKHVYLHTILKFYYYYLNLNAMFFMNIITVTSLIIILQLKV
jgi:hypothetical protein